MDAKSRVALGIVMVGVLVLLAGIAALAGEWPFAGPTDDGVWVNSDAPLALNSTSNSRANSASSVAPIAPVMPIVEPPAPSSPPAESAPEPSPEQEPETPAEPQTRRRVVTSPQFEQVIPPYRATGDFLKREQQEEGFWIAPDADLLVANTSVAVLSYLAAGHTHREGEYKPQVKMALRAMKNLQTPDGALADLTAPSGVLNHALGTFAMAESYGMTGSSLLKHVAAKARDPLLAAAMKTDDGALLGWPRRLGDFGPDRLTTAIALLAIDAMRIAEIEFTEETWASLQTLDTGDFGSTITDDAIVLFARSANLKFDMQTFDLDYPELAYRAERVAARVAATHADAWEPFELVFALHIVRRFITDTQRRRDLSWQVCQQLTETQAPHDSPLAGTWNPPANPRLLLGDTGHAALRSLAFSIASCMCG